MEIGDLKKLGQAIRSADLEGNECEWVRVSDLVMLLNAYECQVAEHKLVVDGFMKETCALRATIRELNTNLVSETQELGRFLDKEA